MDSKSAPEFHYEEVDVSLITPRKRDYSTKKQINVRVSRNMSMKLNRLKKQSHLLLHVKIDLIQQPYEEEFEIPYRPNMNVISALMEIRRNPVNAKGKKTTPVTWEMNCLKKYVVHVQWLSMVSHVNHVQHLLINWNNRFA